MFHDPGSRSAQLEKACSFNDSGLSKVSDFVFATDEDPPPARCAIAGCIFK